MDWEAVEGSEAGSWRFDLSAAGSNCSALSALRQESHNSIAGREIVGRE